MRRLDLTSQRFGRLVVIGLSLNPEKRKKKESQWDCVCDCGNKITCVGWQLKRSVMNSCGCLRLKNDRTGDQYGYWTVLKYSGNEYWLCKCECGTIKNVKTSSFHGNRSQSCGCPKPLTDEEHVNERKEFILNNIIKKRNGCWIWKRYKCDKGYGTIYFRKKVGQRVHRVSWILWKSEIPEGMYVCHKCDNPSCCNPDHLFLGTHEENMLDMKLKGRACKGEKSHLHRKNRIKKCQTN